MSLSPPDFLSLDWFRRLRADNFAALEAARLTPSAEPDAQNLPVMSGGADPAGAANLHV